MVTLIESIAIIMLGLGLIKNLIGYISPKNLRNMGSMMSAKNYAKNKNLWIVIMAAISGALVYVSFLSGLSLAQWIVAGYSAILLFFVLFMCFGTFLPDITKSIFKLKDNQLRRLNMIAIILCVVGLYFLIF